PACRWQDQASDLVHAPRPTWADDMRIPWVALAVFLGLLIVCRMIRRGTRLIARATRRRLGLGEDTSKIAGVVVVAALLIGVAEGVVPRVFFEGANLIFSVQDGEPVDGLARPYH